MPSYSMTRRPRRNPLALLGAFVGRSLRVLVRWRAVWLLLLTSLLLTGCVKYDVGVNFDSPQGGTLVQQVRLDERIGNATAQQWLDGLTRRARQLQGSARRSGDRALEITLPFDNGRDLNRKFNAFFEPSDSTNGLFSALPDVTAQFALRQNNWIFWVRNRLVYDLDLRSLGVTGPQGNVIVSPGSLVDLDFRLTTPGGARPIVTAPGAIAPQVEQDGRQLLWHLKAGQINHLEAVFWMANPVAFGALLIVAIAFGGWYLRYRVLPAPSATPPSAPEPQS